MLYTLSGGTCFESRSGYYLCEYESLSAFPESRQANSSYNVNGSISKPYLTKFTKLFWFYIVVEV
jgi:hypothetical protein